MIQSLCTCLRTGETFNNISLSKNIIKGTEMTYVSLLLMCLLIQGYRASTCAVECASVANSCYVCFQTCQQSQPTTYSFYNCSQTATYSSQPQSNAQGTNTQDTIFIYGQKQCQQKCCTSQLSRFGLSSFSQCSDQESISRIQAIVIGCVITVIVICFFVCCCSKTLRQKVAGCLCMDTMKQSEDKKVNNSIEAIDGLRGTVSKQNLSLVIEQIEIKTCAICLCASCQVSTQCGHCFHLQCLKQWHSRTRECPVCKNKQIEMVNLYCAGCHKSLHRQIRMSLVEQFKINISRQSLCELCLEKQ